MEEITLSLRSSFIGRAAAFIARSAFILGGLLPAVGIAQAPNLTVCAGKGYTLTSNVEATGTSPVTYEWYENGENMGGAYNTASISITEGRQEGTYYYARKASNAECLGGVFSNTYTVVVQGTPPAEPTDASANARCGSGAVTFSATVQGDCTIDWYTEAIGGSIVGGGSSVTSFSPSIGSSTTYYAEARNTTTGCVSAARLAVGGTVHDLPVVASVSASTLCTGGTATLTATVSGGGTTSDMTYTWNIGGTTSTTDEPTMNTQSLTENTAFTVTVTNSIGCMSVAKSGTITITNPATSGQAPNACGCASGLTTCGGMCVDQTCSGSSSWSHGCGFTQVSNTVSECCGQTMIWDNANSDCQKKGEGWRLPTLTELECMCKYRTQYPLPGGFKMNGVYWSATAIKNTYYVLWFGTSGCDALTAYAPTDAVYVKCVK